MTAAHTNSTVLAERLAKLKPGEAPVVTSLETSSRVLRRVTDGIYREPWAALRELISNAYDADATMVEITTDPPWFRKIIVRDDGNGFTRAALISMLHNIGGSKKRTEDGKILGVSSAKDQTRSPGGRRLIGKLGIGLFAISHLSQQFRIITKAKGEKYRTIADIVLARNSENGNEDEIRKQGEAAIHCVPADDVDSHGTDIIIDDILPKTRAEFQSADQWALRTQIDDEEDSRPPPPYHIGLSSGKTAGEYEIPPRVPWNSEDNAIDRFTKLARAMFDRVDAPGAGRKPSLATTFDNYFRFIWLLALGAPLDYIEKHPFDLDAGDGVRFFQLGALKPPSKAQAKELMLPKGVTLREYLKLQAPERGNKARFEVVVDGLGLRRPIRVLNLKGSESVPKPLLFVGSDNPDLAKYDPQRTGGSLAFEGYLLWSHEVVPFDHAGALVRVGDSSGSLFDQTFMNYAVSEQTRKEQVTSEIFALQGLDAALNIDRESFNRSHPHHLYITRWLHDAFRQFANQHKTIGKEVRSHSLVKEMLRTSHQLESVVKQIVKVRTDGNKPVPIEVTDDPIPRGGGRAVGLVISRSALHEAFPTQARATSAAAARFVKREETIKAVMQVLYAAGLLDRLSARKINELSIDLARVIFCEDRE